MVAIRAHFSWKVLTRTLCGALLSSSMLCTEAVSGESPVRLVCGAQCDGESDMHSNDTSPPAAGPVDLRGRTIVVVLEDDTNSAEDNSAEDAAIEPAETDAAATFEDAEPATMQEALDAFYADCNATHSDAVTDDQLPVDPRVPWESAPAAEDEPIAERGDDEGAVGAETYDCQYDQASPYDSGNYDDGTYEYASEYTDEYEYEYASEYDASEYDYADGQPTDENEYVDTNPSADEFGYGHEWDADPLRDTSSDVDNVGATSEAGRDQVDDSAPAVAQPGVWKSWQTAAADARQLTGIAWQAVEVAASLQWADTVRGHVGNMWAHADELLSRSELGQAWQGWYAWASVVERLASGHQGPELADAADEGANLVGPAGDPVESHELAVTPPPPAVTSDVQEDWCAEQDWYTSEDWYVNENPLLPEPLPAIERPADREESVTTADFQRDALIWAARTLDRLGVACQQASRRLERMATRDTAGTTLARQPDTVPH